MAGVKPTDFPLMDPSEFVENTELYTQTGGVNRKIYLGDIVDYVAQEIETPPQVYYYRALLNQSGTNAPVATVLQNDLGLNPVWTYDGAGVYFLNISSAQAYGQVVLNFSNVPYHDVVGHNGLFDLGEVTVRTFSDNPGTVAANFVMFNTLMEILIFPVA
jgi:hypothetical protein